MSKIYISSLKKRFIFLLMFSAFISGVSFADNVEELRARLDALVSQANYQVSVQVVGAANYDVLYAYNPGTKMIPASITKVITTAAAFEYLGADYQFKTVIYTDSKPEDGVINGNIYIKGYGDPDLNSSDIMSLAKQVADKGIKEIRGNVIYDESYLDNTHLGLSGMQGSDTKLQYWPYVSALNVDKNPGNFDPAAYAGDLFSSEMQKLGISLGGGVFAGVTPPNAEEITMTAHFLKDVITYMNKISNNHSAITIFKVIGAKEMSPPGTYEKGSEAIMNFLISLGNDRYSFEILEGSGLTRYNVVTSDLYMRLLKYMYDKEKIFDTFYDSLPIAGIDGTLRDRMVGTEAEKNVHAKTGTINSVSALTGYAVDRDNELLIFYAVMNGFGGSNRNARDIQDAICEELCTFSRK